MAGSRQEKRRLDYKSPDFTITDVDLTFDLDLNETVVTATSKVKRLEPSVTTLSLDGDNLKLLQVLVNGEEITNYAVNNDVLFIPVGLDVDELTLTIKTQIFPKANTTLMGLYVSDGKFCTQCEPEGFRRITFFLDHPDVLAKYTTHINAPEGAYPYMLSNGNMISDKVENGIRKVTWQDPFPKPSYLFALVAGDFDELTDKYVTKSGKNVDICLYVDKGQRKRGEYALSSIVKAFAWDEKRFNLEYDLDRFMVVAVDFFNAGAMENKGLNIFNSKFVLADPKTATDVDIENVLSVIGHEYFHNWTGDRVTCRDWFQLSLKEGLTVFRDQEFSSDLGCRPIERIKAIKVIKGPQFSEDAGPMAHPIRPDFVLEMNNFYSVTVYDKGAEVIRMIHTILGEEKFQKGMQLYFKNFDGKAVTCEDFVASMEEASGIDLHQFRNWYSQAGTPEVTVSLNYVEASKQAIITLRQSTPATPNQSTKAPFLIPISLALYSSDGQRFELKRDGKKLNEVQLLNTSEVVWTFDDVTEKPILALFQNFSAPVKYFYPYSEAELLTLLKYADDAIVRFDAVQSLINNYVVVNVVNAQRKTAFTKVSAIVDAFKFIMNDKSLDRRFVAYLLKLPSVNTLMEIFKVVDIDAIVAVRNYLFDTISLELAEEFKNAYADNYALFAERVKSQEPYECSEEQVGQRELASSLLPYYVNGLKLSNMTDMANEIVKSHYDMSDNMTDVLTAMNVATQANLNIQNEILADFEAKWHDNGLVLDNYFRAISSAPYPETLAKVKELMKHPSFDMGNPNRVRALIGNFAMNNPECFNAIDGSGYEFLTKILKELNNSNAHVAARIMTPMINLNRLDLKRKELITKCFKELLALDNLSDSIFEKIDKALKQ